MFQKLIESYKQFKSACSYLRTTMGRAITIHINQSLYSKNGYLRNLPKETKKHIAANMHQIVHQIEHSEDPFLTMRAYLSEAVYVFASYTVIILNQDELEQIFADWEPCPYISCELQSHIQILAPHITELKKMLWEFNNNLTNEELLEGCRILGFIHLFYMNGINLIRIYKKDYKEQQDWFKPFVQSTLIAMEDRYRKIIGIPSLFTHSLDLLRHLCFSSIVENGSKDPYLEFQKILDGSFNKHEQSFNAKGQDDSFYYETIR